MLTRAVMGVAAATALAACGAGATPTPSPSPSPAVYALSGSLELKNFPVDERDPEDCAGTEGYADIHSGVGVVVRDASGVIVGKGLLSKGEKVNQETCSFTFRVERIPESTFYSLAVGSRDAPVYSFAELQAQNWDVALTIGD